MSVFPERNARRRAVDGIPGSSSEHDALWARVVWSVLTEPGDAVAGALVESLGAFAALEFAFGSEEVIGGRASSALSAARERWRPRLVSEAIEAAFRRAHRSGLRVLIPEDENWPHALNDLGVHAPLCLWMRGTMPELVVERRSIALVGARAATSYGEHVAMELAEGLVREETAVVSGAAYGIDGAAHRATLATGGATVAVLAGGVDRSYPAGHTNLIEQISRSGAVLSEVAPGTAPSRWRFLQRNRLIAALSQATVVIEAGHRSGSLNTAGHAAALGRALGAVPGPVTSPSSAGCHRLLREYDAVCVTGVDDVRELLGGTRDPDGVSRARRPDEHTRVLDALSSRASRSLEDIARRAGMALAEITSILGLLELEDLVHEDLSGWRRARAARG